MTRMVTAVTSPIPLSTTRAAAGLRRRARQQVLTFLQQAILTCLRVQLHFVMDNSAVHEIHAAKARLAENSRFRRHFISTSA